MISEAQELLSSNIDLEIQNVFKLDWEKQGYLIIDVRSPREYAEDHIIGSINLPVLYDEEYEKIGQLYKFESGFEAKKIGAQWRPCQSIRIAASTNWTFWLF